MTTTYTFNADQALLALSGRNVPGASSKMTVFVINREQLELFATAFLWKALNTTPIVHMLASTSEFVVRYALLKADAWASDRLLDLIMGDRRLWTILQHGESRVRWTAEQSALLMPEVCHIILECVLDAVSVGQVEQAAPVEVPVPVGVGDVQWVVNSSLELGVRIHGTNYTMYKGESMLTDGIWRPVAKREFGEVCRSRHVREDLQDTVIAEAIEAGNPHLVYREGTPTDVFHAEFRD